MKSHIKHINKKCQSIFIITAKYIRTLNILTNCINFVYIFRIFTHSTIYFTIYA